MKSNTKFIWAYTIILFSFALVLILFAGMTQKDYAEELAAHQTAAVGMQKSVSELSEVNMKLRQENEQLKAKETENNELMHQMNENIDVFNTLSSALREYDLGKKQSAREILKDLDKQELTGPQLYIYNKIMR